MTTTTRSPGDRLGSAVRGDFVARHFAVISISIVFGLLFVFFSIRADAFLTPNNLVNVLRQVAPTVIVARSSVSQRPRSPSWPSPATRCWPWSSRC
jgi:simple sugar transport system permease protein